MVIKIMMPPSLGITAFLLCCLNSFALHADQSPNAGFEMRPMLIEGQAQTANGEKAEDSLTPGLITKNSIEAQIAGPIVNLTVRQSFKNTTPYHMEGLYRFPLPDDASVYAFSFQVANRVTTGVVKEKKQAEKEYRAAIKAGKRAALLSEHRPNVFSTVIGNIPPGETIEVQVELVSLASLEGSQLSWRLPMAIMPRYVDRQNGLPKLSSETNDLFLSSADFYLKDPSPVLASFTAHMAAAQSLQNITINGALANQVKRDGGLKVTPTLGGIEQDRDMIFNWTLKPTAQSNILTFKEDIGRHRYVMALLMPPENKLLPKGGSDGPADISSLAEIAYLDSLPPRDLVFIMDTSGSMHGDAIKQAKAGLASALEQLRPQDRFDVIEFNSAFTAFAGGYLDANQDSIEKAVEWVERLQSDGGTEMAPALAAAMEAYSTDPERLSQVVFLTDGAVSEEAALFKYVQQQIGDKRLFTIAVGPAPNGWFMRKSAEIGRGSFTQINDFSDVAADIKSLMKDIAAPRLTDLELDVAVDSFPMVQPDLYGGRAHMIIYRSDRKSATRTLSARDTAGYPWTAVISDISVPKGKGISKLWARKKIESLIDKQALEGGSDALRADMIETSLTHQVLSPVTRFVAVDHEIVRQQKDAIGRQIVKANLPKGASPAKLFAPQGAIGLQALWQSGMSYLLLGVMLIVGGCFMARRKTEEVS